MEKYQITVTYTVSGKDFPGFSYGSADVLLEQSDLAGVIMAVATKNNIDLSHNYMSLKNISIIATIPA